MTYLIQPVFFGTSLLALRKGDGGVLLIAIGCTLRWLVAKVGCAGVVSQMVEYLSPLQLGYGTRHGAEAAVHSARTYLKELEPTNVMVKLDPFNSIRRDKVLAAALEHTSDMYPFIQSCYSFSSHLFYDDSILLSQEGVQQGDPLSPLLFYLVLHLLIQKLQSELRILYLDDGLVGGSCAEVLQDIKLIQAEAPHLGLHLSLHKSEIICVNLQKSSLLTSSPELIHSEPTSAHF
jgi:hypothetical protein